MKKNDKVGTRTRPGGLGSEIIAFSQGFLRTLKIHKSDELQTQAIKYNLLGRKTYSFLFKDLAYKFGN